MALYTAFVGNTDNSVLGDIYALNGTEGTATGTSVTYTDPVNLPGVTITLTGTGITGTPASTWHITGIAATFGLSNTPIWSITGLTGIDGTPTSGPGAVFDANSIFQAVAFHDPSHLLFQNNDVIIGPSSGSAGLFGYAGNDVIVATGGTDRMGGDGGFDILVGAHTGHDAFIFNSKLDPTVNLDTIVGFSASRDKIELRQIDFNHIHHHGLLEASEFHSGPGAPSTTGADIVYNTKNGHLYYDANGSAPGGLIEFAVVVGHHPVHDYNILLI
jgi:hypothetical protein